MTALVRLQAKLDRELEVSAELRKENSRLQRVLAEYGRVLVGGLPLTRGLPLETRLDRLEQRVTLVLDAAYANYDPLVGQLSELRGYVYAILRKYPVDFPKSD